MPCLAATCCLELLRCKLQLFADTVNRRWSRNNNQLPRLCSGDVYGAAKTNKTFQTYYKCPGIRDSAIPSELFCCFGFMSGAYKELSNLLPKLSGGWNDLSWRKNILKGNMLVMLTEVQRGEPTQNQVKVTRFTVWNVTLCYTGGMLHGINHLRWD